MLTRPIPKSGEPIPVIGLGSWQTFDVGRSEADRAPLADVLRTFVELGGRLIDTSPMYNNAEDVIGSLVSRLNLRDKVFLASKVWITGQEAGIEQMKDSMWKLHAHPIDLIQVHNLVDDDEHLDTLEAWKKEGRVRYIGVTHYEASAHQALAEVMRARPLDFVQLNYSIGEREAEKTLLPLARDLGVAVIVNRPFATGDLFRRLKSRALPGWAADIGCATWSQVLLKFVVSHPAVTCAIPATAKAAHVRENMAAGEGPMPDAALRDRMTADLT